MDVNYTAAGCQGAIQLSMLAAYKFNNNVLSARQTEKDRHKHKHKKLYFHTAQLKYFTRVCIIERRIKL